MFPFFISTKLYSQALEITGQSWYYSSPLTNCYLMIYLVNHIRTLSQKGHYMQRVHIYCGYLYVMLLILQLNYFS